MWEMIHLKAAVGETVALSGKGWRDPDGDALTYEWFCYPEPSGLRDEIQIVDAKSAVAQFKMPNAQPGQTLHFILAVTDNGQPRLTRYQRVLVSSAGKN